MPPKRANDAPKEAAECILKYGKSNNVIQWAEDMQTAVTAQYGLTGMFFTTNQSYIPPRVNEEEIFKAFYESEEDEQEEEEEEDEEAGVLTASQSNARTAGRAAARAKAKAALEAEKEANKKKDEKILSKMREGKHERRLKAMETIKENEQKIFSMMWVRMSPASQSRVREEEDFEEVRLTLDCVRLWGFIRETHLTHIFGVGDPMKEVNALEQEIRFSGMRQGDREFISSFKTRFDHQVKANEGAGVTQPSERKLALEFIMKLDPKRYKRMLSQMRNDSLRNDPDAYPSTLASAFRIASGWTNEDPSSGAHGLENNSAYITDTCFVTRAKDPEKGAGKSSGMDGSTKTKKKTEVECYTCGVAGHFARDCSLRKGGLKPTEKTLVAVKEVDEEYELPDEWNVTLITNSEKCFFTKDELLLDTQSSCDLISNLELVTGMRRAEKPITVGGIQSGADPVFVNTIADFGDFGEVYFSESASANILSFASQINSGADITYNKTADAFVLKPANSDNTYIFGRKNVPGSAGRFYVCDLKSEETSDRALVQTVSENMSRYTKREIEQAKRAREMLGRMGFPSVADAINMISSGSNFDLTARDFQRADAIWGKDIASMKGKTKSKQTAEADISVKPLIVQKQQVLAIDIMFIDKLAFLIGVATPLDLTIATSLLSLDMLKPSRAAAVVKRGILYFIGVLSSQGYKTSLIMSDGEGAVGKIQTELNTLGVEVDISGAGGHVPRVERRIQVVKERVRTHIHHVPFTLSLVGLSMCVLYCVSRLNYLPTRVRDGGTSAREAFLGRKPDAKRDFRCSFGDYVIARVPRSDSTMKARVEDFVAMLPTGNRTGSVRMQSVATGEISTRDQFDVHPMPLSVIAQMNALATRDGRPLLRKYTGMIPGSISITPYVVPHPLPDYITPTPHRGMDPAVALRDDPIARHSALELADESGLIPRIHHDNDMEGGVSAAAAATEGPHVNFHDHENNAPAAQSNTGSANYPHDEDAKEGQHESGGAEASGGAGRNGGDENGDEEEIRGAEYDENQHENGGEQRNSAPRDGRSMLEYFRTGGSEIAHVVVAVRGLKDWREAESGTAQAISKGIANGRGLPRERIAPSHRALNITVREALRTRGEEAERVIMKELMQMINKKVWTAVDVRKLTATQRGRVIRSSMFLKEKFFATGEFEKLKARLVAGGDQQDKNLYDDLSAPTVSTCSVFTILSLAAHEGRSAAVVDIGGAFLNAEMKTGVDVHMRLDATMSDLMVKLDRRYEKFKDTRGCITVMLDRALYGCVESASLWYENLRDTMAGLGYTRNPHDICVFNKTSEEGVQCTAAVHVDDLFITSTSDDMIDILAEGLKTRYGEITMTKGNTLNYLGMIFDLSEPGEARVSMKGYIDDMLESCGITGGARTPATDGLFTVREDAELVSEVERKRFHTIVAKMMYVSKKSRPDCLMTTAWLATRVNRCTVDDLVKLTRLMRYVRETKERGIVLKAGAEGVCVKVYIDAAYGVHADGKSHTGSCVVVGDVGAVHCKSAKQQIVSKSSTEAELIALSDSANQALHMRNFLLSQGYSCGPVTVFQDNMSCMALIERGRSGAERTRHIDLRYFWLKERVDAGEAVVKHKGTADMYANLLTKPLQGAQFIGERQALTGWV